MLGSSWNFAVDCIEVKFPLVYVVARVCNKTAHEGQWGEEFSPSLDGRGESYLDCTDIILNTDFASEWHL